MARCAPGIQPHQVQLVCGERWISNRVAHARLAPRPEAPGQGGRSPPFRRFSPSSPPSTRPSARPPSSTRSTIGCRPTTASWCCSTSIIAPESTRSCGPRTCRSSARLFDGAERSYRRTLITNRAADTISVVARTIEHGQSTAADRELNLEWPPGVFSLTHIAIPFPDRRSPLRHGSRRGWQRAVSPGAAQPARRTSGAHRRRRYVRSPDGESVLPVHGRAHPRMGCGRGQAGGPLRNASARPQQD